MRLLGKAKGESSQMCLGRSTRESRDNQTSRPIGFQEGPDSMPLSTVSQHVIYISFTFLALSLGRRCPYFRHHMLHGK